MKIKEKLAEVAINGLQMMIRKLEPYSLSYYYQQKAKETGVEALITMVGNSTTEVILNWLSTRPMIEFTNTPIKLYIYTSSIMLVMSDPQRSLALECQLHPDRFIGVPILNFGGGWGLPQDTLKFHTFFKLDESSCISIITGELDQLWQILRQYH